MIVAGGPVSCLNGQLNILAWVPFVSAQGIAFSDNSASFHEGETTNGEDYKTYLSDEYKEGFIDPYFDFLLSSFSKRFSGT